MEQWLIAGAGIVTAAAAAWDIRTGRIPNRLSYPAAIAGLLARGVLLGWRGLLTGALGLLVAGGVFFLFYAVRALGAGDVKLMAAVGAIVGVQTAIEVMLATALAGGLLAICYMLYHRRIKSTVVNVAELMRYHAAYGGQAHPELNLDNPKALRMPYGVAIAAGVLWSFGYQLWWR